MNANPHEGPTRPAGPVAEQPVPDDGVDPHTYNTFVEGLELEGVELVRLAAERTAPGPATQTRFDVNAGYRYDDAFVEWRYDLSATPLDETNTELGHVEASVILAARTATVPQQSCIVRFGDTSGRFIAYPFLREVIASTGQRLNFAGLLLPLITSQPEADSDETEDNS